MFHIAGPNCQQSSPHQNGEIISDSRSSALMTELVNVDNRPKSSASPLQKFLDTKSELRPIVVTPTIHSQFDDVDEALDGPYAPQP